jgi:hypothetical protein
VQTKDKCRRSVLPGNLLWTAHKVSGSPHGFVDLEVGAGPERAAPDTTGRVWLHPDDDRTSCQTATSSRGAAVYTDVSTDFNPLAAAVARRDEPRLVQVTRRDERWRAAPTRLPARRFRSPTPRGLWIAVVSASTCTASSRNPSA